jgi:hypothetical protein
MADDLIRFKPPQMAKSTWDYLIKFTSHHEGTVKHMYHNHPKGSRYPDVSCGIGFLLPADKTDSKTPSAVTIKDWVRHFVNPDGTPVTEELFKKDWEEAYKVTRVSHPVNGIIGEFRKACALNLNPAIIRPKMAELLVQKLNTELRRAPLSDVDFWNLPAVAQVGIASVNYGFSPTQMPSFAAALKARDFDRAAIEIKLSNMSIIKNQDHWLLMKDAQYLYEFHQGDPAAMAYLPSSVSNWTLLSQQRGALGWGGISEQIMSQ